jgi:plastocyanin
MKKFLFFGAFALYSGFALCASVTITNSGFTFSPDNVTINVGDTVNFQLADIHNAIEVSEATWNANGNAPLPGFSTPLGGGQVTGLTAGVHFYVCSPHASGGMKGKITVTSPSGINTYETSSEKINIYPNPTNGKFTLQYKGSDTHTGNLSGNDQQMNLEIFNILGEKIYGLPGFISQTSNEIDLSSVPDGIYFIRINDRKNIYTEKLIKQ